MAPRVLELVYTSDDLRPLAEAVWKEMGSGWQEPKGRERAARGEKREAPPPPFPWDEDRRALLRAELDAWFARAYGLNRKQLRYILDPADLTPRELENILDAREDVDDPLDPAGYEARVRANLGLTAASGAGRARARKPGPGPADAMEGRAEEARSRKQNPALRPRAESSASAEKARSRKQDPAPGDAEAFPYETFRVLKKNEEARYGEYRTRRLVLEAWRRLESPAHP